MLSLAQFRFALGHRLAPLAGGGGGPPPSVIANVGALTAAGVRICAVSGSTIASGDNSGHFAVVSGYLVVSSAGDTANLNAGLYSLVLDNGQQVNIAVQANAYDVASQGEWNTAIALPGATLAGKTIYVQPDSFRAGSPITTGVDGTAARLRRADYGGLVIEGRVPAIIDSGEEKVPAPDRATIDKFYLRGSRNVTFRHLATTPVAEVKWQLTGEAANHLFGITIDQCHASGAVGDPNGDYSTSSNYPNNGIDIISTQGAANNAVGTLVVTNNLVEWGGSTINLRVDRDAAATCTITGNRVRYFYDDGIGIANCTPTATSFFDCAALVSDNVVTHNIGRSSDSANPHTDAIRFIARHSCTADWTISVHRNRVFVGNSRGNGHMQGILASDFKSTSGDSGCFFKGSAIGNVIAVDNGVAFNIENAKDFVALNNTVVSSSLSGTYTSSLRLGTGSTNSTSSGTHRAERNIAEGFTIGGSPTLVDNLTLGKGGATIPYPTVFDAGAGDWPYPDTIAELMAWFARKAGGPAELAGPYDAGAIGSGAVTWATKVPGSDGVSHVS